MNKLEIIDKKLEDLPIYIHWYATRLTLDLNLRLAKLEPFGVNLTFDEFRKIPMDTPFGSTVLEDWKNRFKL